MKTKDSCSTTITLGFHATHTCCPSVTTDFDPGFDVVRIAEAPPDRPSSYRCIIFVGDKHLELAAQLRRVADELEQRRHMDAERH